MSKPKRILHIVASTMRAGVEMTVMNLYREMDRDKLQFDFVVHDLGNDDFGDEIAQMGGLVFRIPLLTKVGMPKFIKIICDILIQNGPYHAVHTHTDYQGGFSAMAAKKSGVPIRICHAHADPRSMYSLSLFAKIMLGRIVIWRYATQRCACSKNAGIALFGKRATEKGRVKIIRNSIDLSAFNDCTSQMREKLLRDCNADNFTRLIGFVGRLMPVKNPSFVLEMAAEAKKRNTNDRFVFVGTGDFLQELKRKSTDLGLNDSVVFLGTREDVPAIMQVLSIVVVPSLAEGFSLVTAEAQAAGTPVLAATSVPREADMGLDLVRYMRLDAGAAAWVRQMDIMDLATRPDAKTRLNALKAKGLDAKNNVNAIMRLYGMDVLD